MKRVIGRPQLRLPLRTWIIAAVVSGLLWWLIIWLVIRDDSQIIEFNVTKRWGNPPGVTITVSELPG